MGCCCCGVSGRQPRRISRRDPDPESQDTTGPPPPYEAKEHNVPENLNFPAEKLSQEPSIHSAETTTQPRQNIRVGVRSHDHRLYCAAAGGHLAEVKRLLESGFNPSERTICDWCPLHWAAHNDIEHGYEIVKLLVEYGANVNQVSDTGLTPLDLARRAKKVENVKFLETVGAMTGAQVRMKTREL